MGVGVGAPLGTGTMGMAGEQSPWPRNTRGSHTHCASPRSLPRCQGEYQTVLRSPRNWAKDAVAMATEWLLVDAIE